MLECFEKRRAEILAQVEKLDRDAKSASDEKSRNEINDRAWKLVARMWLYRGKGLIGLSNHAGQIRSYLDYHEREAKFDIDRGKANSATYERLDEIRIARELLGDLPDPPLF